MAIIDDIQKEMRERHGLDSETKLKSDKFSYEYDTTVRGSPQLEASTGFKKGNQYKCANKVIVEEERVRLRDGVRVTASTNRIVPARTDFWSDTDIGK